MPKKDPSFGDAVSDAADRKALIGLLNEDLARECQAIIAYVVYSQVLKGAAYMAIAKALGQIDYLGGIPALTPKPVRMSEKAEAQLRLDLENETETIRALPDQRRRGGGRSRCWRSRAAGTTFLTSEFPPAPIRP